MDTVKSERLLKLMRDIQNDIPIVGEYDEDARYTWPARWKSLEQAIANEIQQEQDESSPLDTIVIQPENGGKKLFIETKPDEYVGSPVTVTITLKDKLLKNTKNIVVRKRIERAVDLIVAEIEGRNRTKNFSVEDWVV